MRKLTLFAALGLLLLEAIACKSQYEMLLSSSDVNAKYDAAMNYFQKKKYQKAAQLFESMAVLTSGTARDDTVQYYWGLSNYRGKDFFTAESNFARFIQDFPQSPFASEARFYRLDCLYRATLRWELDQTPTRACMMAMLDRKDYEAGRQYYRMEDYPAARTKLRNVLKNNSNNNYREQVLYYTAMSSYHYARLSVWQKQKERYLVFADDYLNFIGEYPESHYRKELDGIYRNVQKILEKK